jgi:uncharacterized protein with von Willebrand factor type A (vWA) domain
VAVEDLPLIDLFTQLRAAGLPLGIDEYKLVLQALQNGFGVSDRNALKRLCKTLWVKSADEMRLFDHHFEQVIDSEIIFPDGQPLTPSQFLAESTPPPSVSTQTETTPEPTPPPSVSTQTETTPEPTPPPSVSTQTETTPEPTPPPSVSTQTETTPEPTPPPSVSTPTEPPESTPLIPTPALSPELTLEMEDEVQVAKAVLQATSQWEQIAYNHFILTSEYFPVTRRQMKQAWRYLRRPVREGPQTEMDVEATVNQIGHQGILLEPVLVPRRVNRAELLLLIDQDGSMLPFHALSHRLAETALRGGRLGKANIYYFHNCPIDYLYHDPNHQQAESISPLVARLSERTSLLIFSDAGAARGGFSEERLKMTKNFIDQFRQRVRYIAWLNPMPQKRWDGTTAGLVARLVPMFEVSRRGLQDAIDVLRGR